MQNWPVQEWWKAPNFSVGACDTTRICKELHVKENFRLHKNEHNKLSARIKCGCCKKATAVFCHKNG